MSCTLNSIFNLIKKVKMQLHTVFQKYTLFILCWDLDPVCNTWLIGTTQVYNPNWLMIGSAVFAQLTCMPHTVRQTHRPWVRRRLLYLLDRTLACDRQTQGHGIHVYCVKYDHVSHYL